jgi:SAM-dependent methyltransferase
MHQTIFNAFEAICRQHLPAGARVLEVGATSGEDTLLNLPALRNAELRVGVNLHFEGACEGLSFVQVAADGLAAFSDASFDAVLCNSVLEHDAHFYRTLAGIQRAARPGALIVIGVPGYAEIPPSPLLRLAQRATAWPLLARLLESISPGWASSTSTLAVHNYPGDYYRFSPQAMREVLMAGCRNITVSVEMRPPRMIGFGWRCDAADSSTKTLPEESSLAP